MTSVPTVSQCPEPIDTTSLHFKSLTKFNIFNPNGETFPMNTNLVSISQSYGLIFVGTLNGFLIFKSKYVFTPGSDIDQFKKEIFLSSRTTHLATAVDDSHLAVACQTKMGPIHIYIYNIPSFLTKIVIPIKTIPLSKPFQISQLLELQWQPNNENGLIMCFTDGSVSSLSLFQGSGNDIFSLPPATEARCLCWSPKGKQIVIGCRDGSLSQYKPDLKFVKKLSPPPLFNGAVTVVNVLWLSNFQFLAAYKDANKTNDFPVIVIVNAKKNEPIRFINYDDITYSSAYSRPFQFYFSHLLAWNLVFIASANSIEVAVLHSREDNSIWEQWLLADASRAELPLNSNKSETFPLGMAFDYTSEDSIPWGEESLPPMPRLVILSCEGLLITFNVINTLLDAPQLCLKDKKTFDDSWFEIAEKMPESIKVDKTSESSESSSSQGQAVETSKPSPSTFSPLASMSVNPPDNVMAAAGTLNLKIHAVKQQVVPPIPQSTQSQILQPPVQVQTNPPLVFQNPNSPSKWPQKPVFAFSLWANSGTTGEGGNTAMNKSNEVFKNAEQSASYLTTSPAIPHEPTQMTNNKTDICLEKEQKSPEVITEARNTCTSVTSVPAQLSTTLALDTSLDRKKTPETSPNRATHSVYVTALWDEVYHFNLELKGVISRISASRVLIGAEEEKESIRNSIERLKNFEIRLNEITDRQKNEIQSVKLDVIEAFAWLEDARSRNRQRKSPTFIELKKSQDLDPIFSRLMTEIHRFQYYIENQLKQLYSYLMKEWMQHQDSCRHDVKGMMTIPSMEELYKTMHLELKILSKQRMIIEELRRKIRERNLKNRGDLPTLTNSVRDCSEDVDNNRISELFKLADNFLQVKIGWDEEKSEICVMDAYEKMMKKQMSAIAERRRKFTPEKQNILRDILTEREMLKTRSVKTTFTSSSFIRNASSRTNSKSMLTSKWRGAENDSISATESLQFSVESSGDKNLGSPVVENSMKMSEFSPKEPNSSAFDHQLVDKGLRSTVTNGQKPPELFMFSFPSSTTLNETDNTSGSSEQKSTPFAFKAAPVTSSTASFSVSVPKSLTTTPVNSQDSYTSSIPTEYVNTSSADCSSNSFSFKFSDVQSTTSTAPNFSFPRNKVPSAFSPGMEMNTPVSVFRVSQSTASEGQPLSGSSIVFPFSSNVADASSTSSSDLIFGNSPSLFSYTDSLSISTSGNSIFSASSSLSEPITVAAVTPAARSKSVSFSPNNVTPPGKSALIPPLNSPVEVGNTVITTTEAGRSCSKATTAVVFAMTATNNTPPTTSIASMGTVVTTAATPPFTSSSLTPSAVPASPVIEIACDTTESEVQVTNESRQDTQESEKSEELKTALAESDASDVSAAAVAATLPVKTEAETSESPAVQAAIPVLSTTASSATFSVATNSVNLGIEISNSGNTFGLGNTTIETTANIFSTTTTNIFSPTKTITTGSTLFGASTATSSTGSIFGQPPTTTAASGNIFGQASPSSATSTFGQPQKDEVSQTANLFGDVLSRNLSTRNIFETPTSTTATRNIFGKSSGSIFGNISAAATTAVMTTATATGSSPGIFGTSSSNIFPKGLVPQTQMPTSTTSSIFGQSQNANSGNTFFGQNICSSFGGGINSSPNQNPFVTAGGFNSKPVFGQTLFGQGSTGQNPFERTQTSTIFGGTPSTTQNVFQSGSSMFGGLAPGPFSAGQSTTGQTGIGGGSAFQKPLGGNIFGSSTSFTRSGPTPTFGGAPTFGSPATFGSPQKVFGSPQGTFGQNQANAPTFGALANQTDGFANLALQNQSQTPAFGGNTFNQSSNFGGDSNFRGTSFSSWRS